MEVEYKLQPQQRASYFLQQLVSFKSYIAMNFIKNIQYSNRNHRLLTIYIRYAMPVSYKKVDDIVVFITSLHGRN